VAWRGIAVPSDRSLVTAGWVRTKASRFGTVTDGDATRLGVRDVNESWDVGRRGACMTADGNKVV